MDTNLEFISKITQDANSDLREYTARVKNDLASLQSESITEISDLASEVHTLSSQIDHSIGVLDKISDIVGTFQIDLENISLQVLALQDQSNQMNVSHKNRKALYQELDGFLKSLLISPSYIEYLRKEDINDDYISKIGKLDTVLKNLRSLTASGVDQGRSQAVQEIKPQLDKVNAMVCTRVQTLIIQKIQSLAKPKTNIHVIQQSVLKRLSPLMVFLRNHNQYTYVKLTTTYSQTMRKVYLYLLKSYITDSSKLVQEVVTSADIIGVIGQNDDPAALKFAQSSKGFRVRAFMCDGGENILKQIDSDPIVVHVSSQSKSKHNLEEVFRSQNRLFINTITSELIFLCEFFNLKVVQCSHIFKEIFNEIVTHYLAWLKTFVHSNCHDCCALFLMILINELNKENLEQRQFPILQFYFDKISQVLWPRFTQVFQTQLISMKKASAHIQSVTDKLMTKAGPGGRINLVPPNVVLPLVENFVQFVKPLYYLSEQHSFEMVTLRLKQLKQLTLQAIKDIAGKLFRHDKNIAAIFVLNNCNYIKTRLASGKSVQLGEDLKQLQAENQERIEHFINGLVGGYFHELVEVVRKYAAHSLNDSGSDSDRPSYGSGKGEDTKSDQENEGPFKVHREKIGEAQMNKFEEVDEQFQKNWRQLMTQIEEYLAKTVATGSSIDKIILKGISKQVFRHYTIFADLIKSGRRVMDMASMQAQKSILVELKNYERQIK